jgi:hypothetical protein
LQASTDTARVALARASLAPALSADDVRRIVREEVRSAVDDAFEAAVANAKTHAVPAVEPAADAAKGGAAAPEASSFEALLNLELRAHAEAREAALMETGKAARGGTPGLLHGVAPTESRRVHVIVTTDSSSYQQWQLRVCYFWFLKQAAVKGSTLHAFTRVLHTGEPDDLMDEIPTVVVPAGPKPENGGPPIQRPGAVIAWLEAAPPEEEYVLMLEPDHILLRPIALGSVAKGHPLAFLFSYVSFTEHEAALAPHLETAGCSAKDAARTGNSPSLMHRDDLAAIAPGWRDFSLALHADPAVRAAVGWVGEMYGFSLAACAARLWLTLQKQELMLHPPFDTQLGDAALIHYTYGTELFANGSVADPGKTAKEERVWAFDKRYFERDYPQGRITPPPDGAPPSVVRLVDAINEALDALPADASADGPAGGG